MQYDYCAFQQAELGNILESLEQAAQKFEAAKSSKDETARKQTGTKMKQEAERAAKAEPHFSYPVSSPTCGLRPSNRKPNVEKISSRKKSCPPRRTPSREHGNLA